MERPTGLTSLLLTSDCELDDQWSHVLPSSLATATGERKAEWISGRIAVQRALAKAGVTTTPEDFREASHRAIARLPEWRFSISHTREWAFAWSTRENVSIGVDIEPADREISKGVEAKFRRVDDAALGALPLWSVKEAAFKAVPDERQKDLVVSAISISADGRFTCADRTIRGVWYQDTFGELVRSFAWVDLASLI